MNTLTPSPQGPGFAAERYAGQTFRRLGLDAQRVEAVEFLDCTFQACSFGESIFQDCRFSGCRFHDCNLSLVRVAGCRFTSAVFVDSKMVGVNWVAAEWPGHRLGDPLRFERCTLSHSTFLGLSLPGMQILDCVALDVDFRGADLTGSDFKGTDLSESLFLKTDLTRANLVTARNYHIIPGENVLTGARFSLPEALSLLYNLDIILED